ncbi:MAG: metallophosphoesterase [Bacteroidales bacterium]|nr:metallophosphoesterase [Bacteroidales bacterium]MDY6001225.1 metallophosphoesterase [Candidatus Cryptobacteroides sp.]
MKKILGIFCITFLSATIAYGQRELTIIHVNDTHSHLEPIRSGSQKGHGGVIERAAFRDSVVKADGRRNVLFLHAGDFSQGTSYFTVLKGNVEIEMINALKYDCITLGNHELDNGVDELARRVSKVKCPVVVANYDFSNLELGKYVRPYAIVKKAGKRIGIIGLMPDISTLVSKEIADRIPAIEPAEAVNKWAAYLKDVKKCDLVIALTHIGVSMPSFDDQDLANNTRNVDIIIGGHSHTFLKKPYHEKNLDGKDVPIVQDGCWGLYFGEMKVSFN